jgi:hypothetical protein
MSVGSFFSPFLLSLLSQPSSRRTFTADIVAPPTPVSHLMRVRSRESLHAPAASSTGRRQTSGAGELRDTVSIHGQIERVSRFPGWQRAQTRLETTYWTPTAMEFGAKVAAGRTCSSVILAEQDKHNPRRRSVRVLDGAEAARR